MCDAAYHDGRWTQQYLRIGTDIYPVEEVTITCEADVDHYSHQHFGLHRGHLTAAPGTHLHIQATDLLRHALGRKATT